MKVPDVSRVNNRTAVKIFLSNHIILKGMLLTKLAELLDGNFLYTISLYINHYKVEHWDSGISEA